MSIKDYKFAEFTSIDMFEMRLTGVIPDFGYIPSTKRKPFFDFCIEHNFLNSRKKTMSNYYKDMYLCDVLIDFRFAGMFGYRPGPIVFVTGSVIVVQPSFKMHNLSKNSI